MVQAFTDRAAGFGRRCRAGTRSGYRTGAAPRRSSCSKPRRALAAEVDPRGVDKIANAAGKDAAIKIEVFSGRVLQSVEDDERQTSDFGTVRRANANTVSMVTTVPRWGTPLSWAAVVIRSAGAPSCGGFDIRSALLPVRWTDPDRSEDQIVAGAGPGGGQCFLPR